MTTPSLFRRIEEASLRAWPALEEEAFDGWTLRYSDGFTKRANSVQALGASNVPFADRVDRCERWYEARGGSCIFRLTPFSEEGLDDYLADRGYDLIDRTRVLERDATDLPGPVVRTELVGAALPDWVEIFGRLSRKTTLPPTLGRIIEGIEPPAHLGVLWAGVHRRPVGCGLAVHDGELLGLFDIVVDGEERRLGYGTDLVRLMIARGVARGASRVYLQVTQDNRPALSLYGKLGFLPAYDYWYRIRREND